MKIIFMLLIIISSVFASVNSDFVLIISRTIHIQYAYQVL